MGMNYLKGNNPFKPEIYYFVEYSRIEGLQLSSPVTINGLKVGKVKDIRFHNNEPGRIVVRLSLEENYHIPDSSSARIYSLDLMGSKGVQIILSKSKIIKNIGDTLSSSIEMNLSEQVSAQVLPLKIKAEELMGEFDSVLTIVRYIFNSTNRANIDKSFESIKRTFANLENTSISLDTLMRNEKVRLHNIFANVESITLNFRNNNEKLTAILANFETISDSLAKADILQTIDNANSALANTNTILDKINRGEGTMGMLINNDSLYNHLNESAESLDKLLIDIRENPKRYLHYSVFDFGKTIVVDESGLTKEQEKKKRKEEKKNKKKKSKDDTSMNEVHYKIQIRSARNKINSNSKEFKGLTNVEENRVDDYYKYTVGNFNSMLEASRLQNEIRRFVPDAFVVAYYGTEQISVSEAKQMLKN